MGINMGLVIEEVIGLLIVLVVFSILLIVIVIFPNYVATLILISGIMGCALICFLLLRTEIKELGSYILEKLK